MAINPVKIPQNVYVEDRIIGPVTLRQIMITGAGAGISYLLYSAFIRSGLTELAFQILAWVPALIGAAFAFLRINDLSLFRIILLMIESMNKPHTRTWVPHAGITINIVTRPTRPNDDAEEKADAATHKLAEMTRLLEKRQQELSAIAAKDLPRPESTEAVRTHFQDAIATEDSLTTQEEKHDAAKSAVGNMPPSVKRDRIRASSFDPAYSIDTITLDLPRLMTSHDPLPS